MFEFSNNTCQEIFDFTGILPADFINNFYAGFLSDDGNSVLLFSNNNSSIFLTFNQITSQWVVESNMVLTVLPILSTTPDLNHFSNSTPISGTLFNGSVNVYSKTSAGFQQVVLE